MQHSFAPRQGNPPVASHYLRMQGFPLVSAVRLGVMGGSFDPIHCGHLAIAEEARQRYALDAVLFVPAGEPPHKPHGQASAEQRFLMTVLATAEHPRFTVSRLEIDRPGPSYTVDTLRALKQLYPRAVLHLVMGADMALDFPSWREPEAIMTLARVVAVTRPGVSLPGLRRRLAQPAMAGIELIEAPGLAISSTALRERARAGFSLRYLTPDPVAAYIDKEGLYR